jgi:hypothetical protein
MDFTSVSYFLFYTCQMVGENGSIVEQDFRIDKFEESQWRLREELYNIFIEFGVPVKLVTAWLQRVLRTPVLKPM